MVRTLQFFFCEWRCGTVSFGVVFLLYMKEENKEITLLSILCEVMCHSFPITGT